MNKDYIERNKQDIPKILASKAKDNERVDFDKMPNCLSKYSSDFCITISVIDNIINSDEYIYLADINNRIKHICNPKLEMLYDMLGYGSKFAISSFVKKDTSHPESDIVDITKQISECIMSSIENIVDCVCKESLKQTYAKNRIHTLSYYSQLINDDNKSSFTVYFVPVQSSIDEIEDDSQILLVCNDGDIVQNIGDDFSELLVCTRDGSYPEYCVGKLVAESPLKKDALYHYRKYKKDKNINAFNEYLKIMESDFSHPVLSRALTGTFYGEGYDLKSTEHTPKEQEHINKMRTILEQSSTMQDNPSVQ